MVKECVICKKMFDENIYNQKCCSTECSKVKNRQYDKIRKQEDKYLSYIHSSHYKELQKKYSSSIKGKQRLKEYINSFEYKLKKRIWQKNYRSSDKYLLWNQTEVAKRNKRISRINRRARKNNIVEIFTLKQWQIKLDATKGICPGINGKCLNENSTVGLDKLEQDHIYPISKANDNFLKTGIKRIYSIDDVQPLCHKCNASKRDKIICSACGPRKGIDSPLLNNNMITIQNQKVYKPQNDEICMVENKIDNSQITINELKGGNN